MLRGLALLAGLVALPVPGAGAALTVYAETYPLAYFAERIAGPAAEVVLPVPPERDPASWRPGIAEIAAFQAADLILLNGASFADWTSRASLPPARTVDTSRGFADRFISTESLTHSHGPEGEHSHSGTAAFTWLDFGQAAAQAEAIAAALARRVPDQAGAVAEGLAGLAADLDALEAAAKALPAPGPAVRLIASHPRYQYFARAYGLTIESVDWDPLTPPSDADWAAFEELAGGADAVVMIWEAEPKAATRARLEADGVHVVVLPTLANVPAEGDFVSVMATGLADLHASLAR